MMFSPNYCRLQKRVTVSLTLLAVMVILSALAVLGRCGLGHWNDRPGSIAAKNPGGNARVLDSSNDPIASGDDGFAAVSSQNQQFDPETIAFPVLERFERGGRVREPRGNRLLSWSTPPLMVHLVRVAWLPAWSLTMVGTSFPCASIRRLRNRFPRSVEIGCR